MLCALVACSDQAANDAPVGDTPDTGAPGNDGPEPDAPEPDQPDNDDPDENDPGNDDPVAQASEQIETYMIYYARLTDDVIERAHQYDMVIVHPFQGDITAGEIDQIQAGKDAIADSDDDVLVLCYLSIGEDSRTYALTDEQMLNDPRQRFTGPYYLDDNNYDGSPDRNGNFDVAFVNAGHPAWFEVVNNLSFAADGTPGLKEMLTDDTTEQRRGLGCDGVFLDTVDTAAPNSFTDELSANQSEFEWTAAGFTEFIRRLRNAYPQTLILQNRGLFFFNAAFPHYEVNSRSLIDFVYFESYQLDSSVEQPLHPYFSADNKHVFRHRLMAEAQRDDGFQVLSLGYAEGPSDQMDSATLNNPADSQGLGYDLLIQDIIEAEQLSGFRHYLTDAAIVLHNDFVLINSDTNDTQAPIWTSTFNDSGAVFPTFPIAPIPRVGIQQTQPGPGAGEITVQWDVALDYNPVQYMLYYQTTPFDFNADPDLSNATQIQLQGSPPANYSRGEFSTAVANKATLGNLDETATYHFLIRARDTEGNEEENQIVLADTPLQSAEQHPIGIDGDFNDWDPVPVSHADAVDAVGSAGPDWREIRIANDNENLFIYVEVGSQTALNGNFNIYLDADLSPMTGYTSSNLSGLGADFLVQSNNLYAMQSGDAFVSTPVSSIANSGLTDTNTIELAIPLTQLGLINSGQRIGLTFINDAPISDFAPDLGQPLVVELVPPAQP